MRILRIFVFLLAAPVAVSAQDFTFSQFYDVPLYRNPALAGIFNGNIRFTSAYRNQWASVTVPYETKAISAELTFPIGFTNDLFTVGLQVANDVAGDSKLGRTQFLPVFTFHKAFADEVSYLTIGAMGGLIQSQFDPSKLHLGSEYDYATNGWNNPASTILTPTSLRYWDASAGLAFNSEFADGSRYYYGVAVYHILRSKVYFFDQSNDILRPRFTINGGVNFITGNLDHIYMYGDAMMQGGHRQLILGLYYSHILKEYEDSRDNISVSAGSSYRWADAIIPNVRLEMRHWQLGTSYDVNISKLKPASMYRGGLEVTLSYVNELNAMRSRKYSEHIGCPVRF